MLQPAAMFRTGDTSCARLATPTPLEILAPAWGFDVALSGDRDLSTVFRLPNSSPLIRQWLYSRPAELEAVSEPAIDNASTQSSTIYRAEALIQRFDGSDDSHPHYSAAANANDDADLPELPNPDELPDSFHRLFPQIGHDFSSSAHSKNAVQSGAESYSSCSSCLTSSLSVSNSAESAGTHASPESRSRGLPDPFLRFINSPSHGQLVLRATLSSHWFLIPYEHVNGYLIGLGYCLVVFDQLDRKMSVNALDQPYGRFAMDEATGEIFVTAFRSDGLMFVAWTQSISTCERVRELFLFVAPNANGQEPHDLILRNSFYERRNCRMCGLSNTAETLAPPCSGIPRRKTSSLIDFSGFSFPDRRFRGDYFGICVKTLYDRESKRLLMKEAIPILIDIRHASPMVDTMLKQQIRQHVITKVSMGMTPVLCDLVCPSTFLRSWLNNARNSFVPEESAMIVNCSKDGETSSLSARKKVRKGDRTAIQHDKGVVKDAQRIRNSDTVDRETVRHERVRRNRTAAQRANMERKRRIEAMKSELTELKEIRLPNLRNRRDHLIEENETLKGLMVEDVTKPKLPSHEEMNPQTLPMLSEWPPLSGRQQAELDIPENFLAFNPELL